MDHNDEYLTQTEKKVEHNDIQDITEDKEDIVYNKDKYDHATKIFPPSQ